MAASLSLLARQNDDFRSSFALAFLDARILGQSVVTPGIDAAREHGTRWLWTYNNERPNMANGGLTPAQKLKRAA